MRKRNMSGMFLLLTSPQNCSAFGSMISTIRKNFQASFSARERGILEAFHQKFENISSVLSDLTPDLRDLHARKEWQDIKDAACAALKASSTE
jgi:hypothetical protein